MAKETARDAQALARRGFRNGELAVSNLQRLGKVPDALIDQIAGVAGPDTALASFTSIAERMGVPELLAMLDPEELPQVVFVTAHDEHALRAFEKNAADYLLKPVSLERLRRTVERLRAEPADPGVASQMRTAIRRIPSGVRPSDAAALPRRITPWSRSIT